MKHLRLLVLVYSFIFCAKVQANEEHEASQLVDELNSQGLKELHMVAIANWNHDSNITKETAQAQREAQERYAKFSKANALKLLNFHTENFKNESLKRMIKRLTKIDDSILDTEDFLALKDATNRMKTRYAKAKVPSIHDPSTLLGLEPELTMILAKSRNPEELKYYWTNWYDLTGEPNREDFFKYVEIKNKAAKINSKQIAG